MLCFVHHDIINKVIAVKWNDVNFQFGNILRKYREARGYSQNQFAEMCQISRAYYGRIERGEHSITLETCKKISDTLSVPLSVLFDDII